MITLDTVVRGKRGTWLVESEILHQLFGLTEFR